MFYAIIWVYGMFYAIMVCFMQKRCVLPAMAFRADKASRVGRQARGHSIHRTSSTGYCWVCTYQPTTYRRQAAQSMSARRRVVTLEERPGLTAGPLHWANTSNSRTAWRTDHGQTTDRRTDGREWKGSHKCEHDRGVQCAAHRTRPKRAGAMAVAIHGAPQARQAGANTQLCKRHGSSGCGRLGCAEVRS